jgi:putative aminopeptidase FrvX
MVASFPARRSAPQRRRGQQDVERLGGWDWLSFPGQLVEIVKAIQRQG